MKQTVLAIALLPLMLNAAHAQEPAAAVTEAVADTVVEHVTTTEAPVVVPDAPADAAPAADTAAASTDAVDETPAPAVATISKGPRESCKHKSKQGHGSKHGKQHRRACHHNKHHQVVQRLDLIEARMAKIEAMLESLMRR